MPPPLNRAHCRKAGQRKRMLGLSSLLLRHLSRISRPSHSIRVYSPTILATLFVCTAPTLLRPSLCSLISHISCHRVEPFCQDILITGVTPDATCSSGSQSPFSCFPLPPVLPLPYCHTDDNTYLSVDHIETVILKLCLIIPSCLAVQNSSICDLVTDSQTH